MSVHKKLYINDTLYTEKVEDYEFPNYRWGHLSTVDQNLASTDTPVFSGVKIGTNSNCVNIKYPLGSGYNLQLPESAPATGKSLKHDSNGLTWVDNAGFDQSLNTDNNVGFVNVTSSGQISAHSFIATNGFVIDGGSIDIYAGNLTLGTGAVTLEHGDLIVSEGNSSFQAVTATSLTVSGSIIAAGLEMSSNIILSPGASVVESVTNIADNANITDGITVVETISGPVQLTLPTNASSVGKSYSIYFRTMTNDYKVNVVTAGGDLIESLPSFTLDYTGQHITLTAIGNGIWIIR